MAGEKQSTFRHFSQVGVTIWGDIGAYYDSNLPLRFFLTVPAGGLAFNKTGILLNADSLAVNVPEGL